MDRYRPDVAEGRVTLETWLPHLQAAEKAANDLYTYIDRKQETDERGVELFHEANEAFWRAYKVLQDYERGYDPTANSDLDLHNTPHGQRQQLNDVLITLIVFGQTCQQYDAIIDLVGLYDDEPNEMYEHFSLVLLQALEDPTCREDQLVKIWMGTLDSMARVYDRLNKGQSVWFGNWKEDRQKFIEDIANIELALQRNEREDMQAQLQAAIARMDAIES